MSRGTRDNQRSRVYAWEARATEGAHHTATWKTLEECEAFLKPIWRAERGRVGRAKVPMPTFSRELWGQRSATASSCHVLKIPRWARNPWVVLHEAAHRLTPRDEAHGPRFVGVLIGLVARHDGRDANALMALADEMGVRYHVRSIGAVPVRGVQWQLARALRSEPPMSEMDLACWLDCSYLQVRGAAMGLIRNGQARWLRGKLVPMGDLLPPPPPAKATRKAPGPTSTKGLAKLHGIEIENMGSRWNVWPPGNVPLGVIGPDGHGEEDPFEGDHGCDDWGAVDLMVRRYAELLTGVWPTPGGAP